MKEKHFNLTDDFESIIANSLPGKKIKKTKLIPTGWTNIVYEVEANDEKYFFRFPRDEFWSRTIVKDYQFSKYIHGKTKYNTIKLELLYDNERPYSMHKKIEGSALAEKMDKLTEKEVDNIAKQISEFMVELHTLEYDRNRLFTLDNIGVNLQDFLDELLDVHVDEKDKKFWNKLTQSENEMCLVHGDLNSSNILLDENNNISAIIDFGFGGYGNKYDDIARIIGRCPDTFKNSIVKYYEEYSKDKIDNKNLEKNMQTWSNIDNAYINYMRKIGIYE